MTKKTKIKRFEFSKIIVTVLGATALTVVAFTLYMVYTTKDLTPLSDLITGVSAAVALGLGFYFYKAKAENLVKLRKKYGSEVFNDAKEGFDDGF